MSERANRLKTLRVLLSLGRYRPDPAAIADSILGRAWTRIVGPKRAPVPPSGRRRQQRD